MKKYQKLFFTVILASIWGIVGAQQPWYLIGNTVAPGHTDFLGTLNALPLDFRVANHWSGTVDKNGPTFMGYDAGNANSDSTSTGFGKGVLKNAVQTSNGTGSANTGMGHSALYANTTGSWNCAFGAACLVNNTTGLRNSGFGAGSLFHNSTGSENTGLGAGALHFNQTGSKNTALGSLCLVSNTVGDSNTAAGYASLAYNTTGRDNTAIGTWSLGFNTTGSGNTSLGLKSLGTNTIGSYNVGIGLYSLASNVSGDRNTALGWNTLSRNTIGQENTAAGSWSLYSNTTGNFNTAYGVFSMNLNTEGSRNTALGWNTLSHNINGSNNIAIGPFSLYGNTTGEDNVAMGQISLASNSTGIRNLAIGSSALNANSIGYANSAGGFEAARSVTKGHGNVAFGYRSLGSITTGNDNTAVGNQAFSGGSTYNNSSALGYQAQPLGSNEVVLGNASIVRLRCHTATITTGSDRRIKDDVQENVPGLEFIQRLRPVTYHLNVDNLNALLGVKDSTDSSQKYAVENRTMTGFIAQEVEEAARASKYDFSGVDRPDEAGGLYGLRYSEFVVPLVKAVQELNTLATTQDAALKAQSEQINALTDRLERMEAQLRACSPKSQDDKQPASESSQHTGYRLDPNSSNPATGSTRIGYSLPETAGQCAIHVTDMGGNILASLPIQGAGEGQVTLETDGLSNGLYIYSLTVDGKAILSHRMVVSK